MQTRRWCGQDHATVSVESSTSSDRLSWWAVTGCQQLNPKSTSEWMHEHTICAYMNTGVLEVWQITEQPPVTSVIQNSRPMQFGHLIRTDESAEFLPQFPEVTGKGWQDVLTPPGWPQWRTTTTSVWKMPPSWHWTDHSGGYWQQAELCTVMLPAEQWWWW